MQRAVVLRLIKIKEIKFRLNLKKALLSRLTLIYINKSMVHIIFTTK